MFVHVGVGEGVREQVMQKKQKNKKSTCAAVAKSGTGCGLKTGHSSTANGHHYWCQVVADGDDELCDEQDQFKVVCPCEVGVIRLFLSMGN